MKPIALFLVFYTALTFSFRAVNIFDPSCAWLVCLAIIAMGAGMARVIWVADKEKMK